MEADFEHLKHLDSLAATSASGLREAALDAIRRATGGHCASFFQFVPADGKTLVTNCVAVGKQSMADVWLEAEGKVAPEGSSAPGLGDARLQKSRFDITRPLKRQVNAFSPLCSDYLDWDTVEHSNAAVRSFYGPMGMTDQVRMFVYDGPRFVGYVASLRSSARRDRYSPAYARRLNRFAGAVADLFRRADLLERLDQSDDVRCGVLDEQGRLTHGTGGFEAWHSNADHARALEALLIRLRKSAHHRLSGSTFGWVLRLTQLSGPSGHCFHVEIDHAPSYAMATESVLTPRQREVAQRLAQGESTADVAIALGCSENTVKHHTKEIYRRLGLRNRTELAAALHSP